MSGGQLRVPLTVRVQGGVMAGFGAHHSQSLEAWFLHVPGLKVVMPSNAADAKGLLKAAIRDDNPVLFIEHRALYAARGEVPDNDYAVGIGSAALRRPGTDVTLVALAKMVDGALAAAEDLGAEGISAEVIDPRSLCPLDLDTIADSVRKTGRLVIVHEAVENGGAGAELTAQVQEAVLDYLDSPILRVAAPFTPVPYSRVLERQFMPGKKEIIEAVGKALGHGR
jgi:pyruvate dehydrogenase E1 component beta subunit